jgi:hypothetical protein
MEDVGAGREPPGPLTDLELLTVTATSNTLCQLTTSEALKTKVKVAVRG